MNFYTFIRENGFLIDSHLYRLQKIKNSRKVNIKKIKHLYYTHRGSRFDRCVGFRYFIQKMKKSSPLKVPRLVSYLVVEIS